MARKPDRTAQAIGAGVASFVGVLLGGLPGALIGAAIGHWASGEASKFGAEERRGSLRLRRGGALRRAE
jgi:hypothetical protein